jgi:hypothetical protein
MSFRFLIDPDGSRLLVEPGSYLLWEPEIPVRAPARRVIQVDARAAPTPVPARGRVIHVPPRQQRWVE